MSNLIKVSQYVPVDILKQLNLAKTYEASEEQRSDDDMATVQEEVFSAQDAAAEEARKQMLADAKAFAESQVKAASDQAEQMLAEARQQIEAWWTERREQDEHLVEAVKSEAFNEGFEEGRVQAEQTLKIKIDEMMSEASAVLQQAYIEKERIIQEAEPFLVELSCAIAEKIIDRQLELKPEYSVELIKKSLSRKREQGVLTLCVSPSQFAFVQAAREELSLVIDSQAELQILPDASVQDRGCVIRSSFGSVDARIDTQLSEIKKELLRISRQTEERGMTNDDH
ncbi:flagellar assembly protein FliH [Paenibacillus faecis]|uniref:Flagellar assembly protein FliH n=1 Tax=Paenibacillus faecis TaxID=862114 RepID=A0A5D0CZP3_9BACL|nr:MULTISPECIES: FliH/SctL family protein [Paenibacillus]MCA1294226.1 flagellar assembly protein FliH [Paenibacillus sp. alder61]TYA14357.1 flagellar assembly protein FliH [Paenibacillus faecis]GIO83845.1 flagellar assembly protein FliH [Paenibacillus faecis]